MYIKSDYTWEASNVHFLEILRFQNDHGEFAGCGNVTQWEADVTKFILLYTSVQNIIRKKALYKIS